MSLQKISLVSIATAALLQLPNGYALGVMNVSTAQAEGRTGSLPTITLWQGSGQYLDFSATGGAVVSANIDDPSRAVISIPGCNSSSRCDGIRASFVRVLRINKLNFQHLPSTPHTLLSVTVSHSNGVTKLYQFVVQYGSGKPQYARVNVNPDTRAPAQERQRVMEALRQEADFIEQGLVLAEAHNRSSQNELVFSRVRIVLAWMRSGTPLVEAAGRARVTLSDVETLKRLAATETSRK